MGCIGVGHRGFPYAFPANTLRSFQEAAKLGCRMVECDVRQAADGTLVLAHDPEVRDVRGHVYKIAEQTAEALAKIDLGAGEGVPRLEELVAWARGRVAVMADMKCEEGDIEEKVVAALSPLGSEEKIVAGAGTASRARFRQLDPTLPLSLTLSRREETLLQAKAFSEWIAELDTPIVTWEFPLLTPERIEVLRAYGKRIYVWTVDEEDLMGHFYALVDGIITNRADRLKTLGLL
ncbi:glycerophosphodiester phosphodiesterase [Chthonomonas calidirosea]|uniref:glycerophosphodiester phosphodiesterase n=1 Tax=Chthonomonas calidirosea TaxID=454171 RepID=UPI0006EC97EA|nr:glycerophosphodiester phosphodiesterase [Chthonomonas calidirosea]CEK19789.1 glycerophosphoryl diester phosphodiesterase [Chthonomonas calidirosea]